MRQAIHILKKDVRHLWPAILVVEALTALFAYAGAVNPGVMAQGPDTLPTLITVAVVLGWWYLIAAVIHQEVLPGHQQFWVTRPYSWKSLVAARSLFILTFINVPKMVADCLILEGQGFHASSYWLNLLASQALFTALCLLPFAVLAAVTANLRQFILVVVLAWLALFLPFIVRSLVVPVFETFSPVGGAWMAQMIAIAIVLPASVLILLWQYSRRRTVVARMMAIGTITLLLGVPHLLPLGKLISLEIRLVGSAAEASSIGIELGSRKEDPMSRSSESGPPGTTQIDFPLVISGLAGGRDLYISDLTVEITGRDGKVSRASGRIFEEEDGYLERIHVDSDFLEQVKEEQVDVRTSAYFAVLGYPQTTYIEPGKKGTMVPGFGICRFVQERDRYAVACITPFRRSPLFAKKLLYEVEHFDFIEPGSYSPFPAEPGISPLIETLQSTGGIRSPITPRIVTEALLSHSRREFELNGLRLEDYRGWRE